MTDFLLANETWVRLGCFSGVLVAVALGELAAPRRVLSFSRLLRWPSNLGIMVVNTLLLRLLLPGAAVGLAALASAQGWGLFNNLATPAWLAVPVCVVALDFAIYLQHVMFHAVPALWRLHRMHHADLDFDVTTGVRFHPIEILLSMLIKFAVILVLGPPVVAVVIFEVVLNATSMFNHGNLRLALPLDRVLRLIVVTPDMHRVHHSVNPNEANSNFGFNLPWWDRLFGTYRAQPAAGHEGMAIGLEQFRGAPELRLDRMLLQPFVGKIGNYPINRRD